MFDAKSTAWQEFKTKLDAFVEEGFSKACEENPKFKKQISKFYPYKMELDNDGEETGRVLVSIKQNSFFVDKETQEKRLVSMGVFDTKGTPIPSTKPVYSGSTVKVSFTVRPLWNAKDKAAGAKLDLVAVQVLQLVTANSARSMGDYGFQEEEGFEVETTDDSTSSSEAVQEADASDPTSF